MKKPGLLALFTVLLVVTGCSQASAPASEPAVQEETAPSARSARTGALRLCDPYGGGVAATGEGCYFTQLREDGNLNIKYLDYATQNEVYLCSQPNCTHDSDACTSWISTDGLIPSLITVGGKLCIIQGGINDPSAGTGDYPYIETLYPDGSERQRVYQADAACEWSGLLSDDENFYTVETRTEQTEGQVAATQYLIQIDLQTGQKSDLLNFQGNNTYICDARENLLYYLQYSLREDAASLSDVSAQCFRYDLDSGEKKQLQTSENGAEQSFFVRDGMLYRVDVNSRQITAADLATGQTEVVLDNFHAADSYGKAAIQNVFDGKLIVSGILNPGGAAAEDVVEVVDLSGGEISAWPLYYDAPGYSSPQRVMVVGQSGDDYIVNCGMQTIAVTYGEESYSMLNQEYALIGKADFWQGIPSYRMFSRIE